MFVITLDQGIWLVHSLLWNSDDVVHSDIRTLVWLISTSQVTLICDILQPLIMQLHIVLWSLLWLHTSCHDLILLVSSFRCPFKFHCLQLHICSTESALSRGSEAYNSSGRVYNTRLLMYTRLLKPTLIDAKSSGCMHSTLTSIKNEFLSNDLSGGLTLQSACYRYVYRALFCCSYLLHETITTQVRFQKSWEWKLRPEQEMSHWPSDVVYFLELNNHVWTCYFLR